MSVLRYFVSVGPALLALMVIINAVFGEAPPRFNDVIYDSALYAPRSAVSSVRQDYSFASNLTPADRVKEVFGQFSVNDGKRPKRSAPATSSAT
ncbi:hypothetical protein NML43_06450 [Rhodopseudomonas palustris]|uniref:hypothetical protein n=1 Tax=Rhodopseudomonas palustris TaxID=1076 RepID=UPI0020CB849B|nr:hypothetical protein [Rhodopseudomonas palustris]MCP9626721.1 hypothetical protein [Rhodopseudomonas palustris]